jgi:hypothetical protein
MNEAVEGVVVGETVEDAVPVKVLGAFVVDLFEETGRMDKEEAELLLSWFEWVEVEVRGFPNLMEEVSRLTWAVIVSEITRDRLSFREACYEACYLR